MTDLVQPGQHPDADQLSAFAEDALPAHERQQTLAHLAVCAHCRNVVSLALPPFEEAPLPLVTPAHRPWLASWKLLVPAAGLAAATILTVVAIRQPAATSNPTVAVVPQRQPEPLEARSAPSPGPVPDRDKPVPAAAKMQPAPALKALPAAPLATRRNSLAGQAVVPSSAAGVGSQGVQSLPIDRRSEPDAQAFGVAEASAGQALPQAPSPAPPQAPVLAARLANGAANGSAAAAAPVAISARALAPVLPGGMHPLPSRLSVASLITRDRQTLALDTAGGLFLSTDSGRNWKPVAAQWQGRAVHLTLASYPSPPGVHHAALGTFAPHEPQTNGGPLPANTSLSGTVTDTSGAAIPNATLVLGDRSIRTDAGGHFTFTNLVPGTYQLETTATGFETGRTTVTVSAAQNPALTIKLNIGSASESVMVASDAVEAAPSVRKRGLAKAAAPAPTQPLTLFQITTESGGRWSSTDGLTWTPN